MKRPTRHHLIALTTGLACLALASRDAVAAISATIQLLPQQASVTVGSPLAVDVYLRNLIDTNVAAPTNLASVDLDFGGTTNATSPVRFIGTAAAPKAFIAAGGFASVLPLPFDASLIDGHTDDRSDLSYSVAIGDLTGGVPTNGADVLVGTLYVTASQVGTYALTTNHAGTLISANDDNATAVTLNHLPALFAVTALPEPTTLAAIFGSVGVALRRRRR